MLKVDKSKVPLNKALGWIFLITLLVSGSASFAFFAFQSIQQKQFSDSNFNIQTIIQACPDNEWINTTCFAEILNLSIDKPSNLYSFKALEAEKKLQTLSILLKAHVKKYKPNTLYIEYLLRQPIAYLSDFSNTFVDLNSVPFPAYPFFSPKKLPQIFLGIQDSELNWGKPLQDARLSTAFAILSFLKREFSEEKVLRIDLSRVYASSYGQKEIIVILSYPSSENPQESFVKILRLNSKDFLSGLKRFSLIKHKALSHFAVRSLIIDLRLDDLAFVSVLD